MSLFDATMKIIEGGKMKKISMPISGNRTLEFIGKKIQHLPIVHGLVEAYITEINLIVVVRYPEYQPTDEIHSGMVHAIIPLVKMYRVSGRGLIAKKLFGGVHDLIEKELNGHYPPHMIRDLLGKISLGQADV